MKHQLIEGKEYSVKCKITPIPGIEDGIMEWDYLTYLGFKKVIPNNNDSERHVFAYYSKSNDVRDREWCAGPMFYMTDDDIMEVKECD